MSRPWILRAWQRIVQSLNFPSADSLESPEIQFTPPTRHDRPVQNSATCLSGGRPCELSSHRSHDCTRHSVKLLQRPPQKLMQISADGRTENSFDLKCPLTATSTAALQLTSLTSHVPINFSWLSISVKLNSLSSGCAVWQNLHCSRVFAESGPLNCRRPAFLRATF